MAKHAILRALERYGLRLNENDIRNLCEECMRGYGRLSRMPDGMERHLLACHGKAIVAIYAPHKETRVKERHGRIITILPPDAAFAKSRNSPATKPNMERARPRGKAPRKARQDRGY